MRESIWFSVLAATAAGLLSGCVSDNTTTQSAGPQTASSQASATDYCASLTANRRRVARLLDDADNNHGAPNSAAGIIGLFGGSSAMTGGRSLAGQDRQRAIDDLRSERSSLDHEIDQRQCTAEARAKAGVIKPTTDAAYNGVYVGKGSTQSWCAQPSLSLTVKDGQLSGKLTAEASYDVKGELYDNGDVSLLFKKEGTGSFTDDVDGRLKDGTLSVGVKLDDSPRACSYQFSAARSAAGGS
ncbi:hypothetical protein SAMN02745126_03442 [Enhydrobacter aerosaccus]|uniref:Lipoprotein n=2 Tax=Enhydrobacter aerosaccus TaxID=225324 RepID=A0A1T4QTH2_9HYPH|nr:hypothetical protein SAMN02745126_03442 [Enhydrobacter aerosaccus]